MRHFRRYKKGQPLGLPIYLDESNKWIVVLPGKRGHYRFRNGWRYVYIFRTIHGHNMLKHYSMWATLGRIDRTRKLFY